MRIGRTILWGLAISLLILGLLVVELWPWVPHSPWGWIAFGLLGPPLYISAAVLSDLFWSSRAGQVISEHPSLGIRILLGVLIGGAALGLVLLATWLVR